MTQTSEQKLPYYEGAARDMPSLAFEVPEDDDPTVESPTVYELMDGFYRLYVMMARDPCFDDLAADVAELINEIDERRVLAAQIAAEGERGTLSTLVH